MISFTTYAQDLKLVLFWVSRPGNLSPGYTTDLEYPIKIEITEIITKKKNNLKINPAMSTDDEAWRYLADAEPITGR